MNSSNTTTPPTVESNLSWDLAEAFHAVLDWIRHNIVVISLIFGAGALGAIGYTIYQTIQHSRELKAQTAFYAVDAKYVKARQEYEKNEFQAMAPKKDPKDPKAKEEGKKKSGDLEKDYGTAGADFEKVIRDFPGSAASAQAAIVATELYLDYKKIEPAVAVSELAMKSPPKHPILKGLVEMSLGNAYAAKGDCAKATESWKEILVREELRSLSAEAALRSGLCFEKLGQADRAAEMYQKASIGATGSSATETAKSLLRAIEVRKAQGTKTQGAS